MSWNNICSQFSLILCPMVLSIIYSWNYNATYYFSAIFGAVGFFIILYLICTRKDRKVLGKVSNENDQSVNNEEEKVEIEMKVEEKKENSEEAKVDNEMKVEEKVEIEMEAKVE